jgi:hypothetical protein
VLKHYTTEIEYGNRETLRVIKLCTTWDVNSQLHILVILPSEKVFKVPHRLQSEWTAEAVWTQLMQRENLALQT